MLLTSNAGFACSGRPSGSSSQSFSYNDSSEQLKVLDKVISRAGPGGTRAPIGTLRKRGLKGVRTGALDHVDERTQVENDLLVATG
jgi:hypothetical protein